MRRDQYLNNCRFYSPCLHRLNFVLVSHPVCQSRLAHQAQESESKFALVSHELAFVKAKLDFQVRTQNQVGDISSTQSPTVSDMPTSPRLGSTPPTRPERSSNDIERIRVLEIENESLGMQLLACDEERLTSAWQIEDLKRNLSALHADLALVTSVASTSAALDNLVAHSNDDTRLKSSSPSLCDELADLSLPASAVAFPSVLSATSSGIGTDINRSDFTEPLSRDSTRGALVPDLDSDSAPAFVGTCIGDAASLLVAENERLRSECALLAEQLNRLQHASTAKTAAQKIALAALARLQLRQDSYRSSTASISGVPAPDRTVQNLDHGALPAPSEADARQSDLRNSNNINSYLVATASTMRRQMPGLPVSGSRLPPAPTSSPYYARAARKSDMPQSVSNSHTPLHSAATLAGPISDSNSASPVTSSSVHRSTLFASDRSTAFATTAPSTPLPIQSLMRVGPLSMIKTLSAQSAAADPTLALIDSISDMCNQ